MWFSEKMCVRIVFVLVLCCAQSWAQRDPTLDQFPVSTDISEHPDMLATSGYEAWPRPIIVQSPGFQNNPENTGMPPEERPPQFWDARQVKHAGVPSNLSVVALPLENSDHELQLNVSWVPSSVTGVPATGYSAEVKSVTDTSDCESQICYLPNLSKNVTWVLVPPDFNTVAGVCVIRPGCAYLVTLQTDPWDGKTTVNVAKKLGECEAGVCSCAHSPRLPVPVVSATTVTFNNTLYSNVSWTLPTPSHPQRLPARLRKQGYIVSLNKQMPTAANTSPIFAMLPNPVQFNTSGLVFEGDTLHWLLLPIPLELAHKVKLLAKVQLVDERGCLGPTGNVTDFAPVEDAKFNVFEEADRSPPSKSKLTFGVYAILGAFAMGAVFVLVLKKVLKSFRPAPVSAPLEPLIKRPEWFSNNYY